MTNGRVLKDYWIEKIESFTVDEIYELLTGSDELFRESICKFCKQIYEPCEENLTDDKICRERFAKWYVMDKNKTQ